MVLLRSACLVLGLLFTSFSVKDSSVHAQQATDKAILMNKNKNGIEATGFDTVMVSKELLEAASATSAASATAIKRLRGRKLLQGSILKKDMMEEKSVNGRASKISGAAHSVGKWRDRSLLPMKKVKGVNGFVAFTADYGKPRHHPPKNN